ncbi:tol-pal system-associated acyl-CoA thioesterase [Alteraurantiacibacter palmitatis]|uniref:Tol-pal system-associated acyl-CoA thioesterase n=1 Tax=Alteraurantiacibacter palmitatis TaxID=2054628 RepID=A0ABV7E826_9SPHN
MSGELQPVSGVIDGARHLFPVRVYYEDTDLSGIVYHANYLKYAERARSDLLRLLGVDQRAAQEAGEGHYAVAEAHIHFRAPARLDDSLTVQTRVAEMGAASVRLVQRVARGSDVLADLTIRVGFVGPNGRPRRQPEAWRAAFESFAGKETA